FLSPSPHTPDMRFSFSSSRVSGHMAFLLLMLLCATGFLSAPLALACGLALAMLTEHPYPAEARKLAHLLLQASVVLLGFHMPLHEILAAGRAGLLYSAVSITLTLAIGLLLGRLLRVERLSSALIAAGTAICGGSAIAALGPVLEAGEEPMAISLGAVFVLNSVALFLFPLLGHRFALTQSQFGLWSALAIHDTSSVVGASARFGAEALAIAVPVKLVRALWILPVCIAAAGLNRAHNPAAPKAKLPIPLFLLWFLLAATAGAFLPLWMPRYTHLFSSTFTALATLGRSGLAVTLFLIGSMLNRKALARVGVRPLLQAVALWIFSASASLYAIHHGWISA
ncbi:MAG TPA: putative sulfate exporter family transporter, partial [Acidobacteriaceae bacterium]|nr:putative sulfate exporter family transporter [Acidobacteriaceae bacterium]